MPEAIDREKLPGSKLPILCAALGVGHILFVASAAKLPNLKRAGISARMTRCD